MKLLILIALLKNATQFYQNRHQYQGSHQNVEQSNKNDKLQCADKLKISYLNNYV